MTENNMLKSESRFVRFYNENKYILLSGVIAFLITQLVAFCFDLVPYGDMTVLRMDLYHQYGPLFAELHDRLTSGSSLVYSWNSGLGSSFLGNFFNYLSSPLSLIVVLFGHKNITEAISVLMMLKAILSAVTFSYYLKKSQGINSLAISGFGVMYAFSGYFVAYYWNVMWIDAMVLFPLIVLGIERITDKGKPALYCISLAVMIFANYYMAYMICIFSFFYFFVYYFSNYSLSTKFNNNLQTKNIFKKSANSLFISSGFKFAVYSIIAALLSAVAVFPLIAILSESSATSGSGPANLTRYFTAFDFLANHLAGPAATIRSSGDDVLPNVYCGILTLILVPLYLYSKKISIKEKTAHVLLLALLYFSFNINYLNYFWHGFHFPNDLPYRFSFMYCFILLKIAYKAFLNLKECSSKEILSVGIGLVFFIVFVEKLSSKNIDDKALIISLVFAVGYVLVLKLFKNIKFQSFAVSVLLVCMICSEIALADTSNYSMNQSKTNYTVDYDSFREIKNQLDQRENNGIYRMELSELRTRMDPCWFNYNGVSVFSSMAFETVSNVQQKLGLYGNYINSYTYNLQTPVYNSLFALKYIADKSENDLTNRYYTKVTANDTFTAYENNYPLSVAFAAKPDVFSWNAYDYENPFIAQSELFRMASGVDGVFEKLEVDNTTYTNINNFYSDEFEKGEFRYSKINDNQSGNVCFEFTPVNTENVYIYIDCKNIDSLTVSSALESKTLSSLDEPRIIDLGIMNAGETVYADIEIKSDSNYGGLDFSAYTVNEENFEKGYNYLHNGNFEIEKYSDTCLVGNITAENESIVFTSIPYDKNWDVYVDGVKLAKDSVFSISKSFLGFNLSQGEHSIILNYQSDGLIVGTFFTCLTIVLLTVITLIKKRKRRYNKWALLNKNDDCTITFEENEEKFSLSNKLRDILDEVDEDDILETVDITEEENGADDINS